MVHTFLWYLIYGHPASDTVENLCHGSEKWTRKQEPGRTGVPGSSSDLEDSSAAPSSDTPDRATWESEMELSSETGEVPQAASRRTLGGVGFRVPMLSRSKERHNPKFLNLPPWSGFLPDQGGFGLSLRGEGTATSWEGAAPSGPGPSAGLTPVFP